MGHVTVEPDPGDAPPQNIDAEESVLGAMLVADRALKRIRVDSGLVPRHFYLEKHSEIFAAICRVADRNGIADELLVAAEIPAHKDLVSELAAKVPAAGNAMHYAEIVLLNAQLRAKLEGGQMIQLGVKERFDQEKSETLIREGLQLAASDFTIDAEPTSGEEILDELFDQFDRGEEGEVFELPWEDLNECVMGGYRRKQMSVLAGWTNMGKSWALDQMLAAFCSQGLKTAIFATEMSRQERAARWLTSRTSVSLERIMRNLLSGDDHHRLAKARSEARGRLPFDYFEAFGWSADRIAERIIYGNYDVVAIDPVTEIPGFEKTEVAAVAARRFAEVAGRADCHVICVSHLNRNRLRDPNGVKPRPVLADLKGSGSLETNAHAVLFLHREQDPETAYILPKGELFFAKLRNGLPKTIEVHQSSTTHQFLAVEPMPEPTALEIQLGEA
jgi:replicative DNA helicase